MTKREWLHQYNEDNETELLIMEGEEFDEAIVGICHRFYETFVLYDKKKVLEVLAAEAYDDEEEDPELAALQHFEYNIMGSWCGEYTPGFVEWQEGG